MVNQNKPYQLLSCHFQLWAGKWEGNGKLLGLFCSDVNLSHCGQVPVKPAYHHLALGFRKVHFLLEIVGGGELKLLGQRRAFSTERKKHEGSLLSPCRRALPLDLRV